MLFETVSFGGKGGMDVGGRRTFELFLLPPSPRSKLGRSLPNDHELGCLLLLLLPFLSFELAVFASATRGSRPFGSSIHSDSRSVNGERVEQAKKRESSSSPPSLLPFSPSSDVSLSPLSPGFRHDSIPTAIEAFKQQGPLYNISFSFSEDPSLFTDDGLTKFDAIAFVSNSDEGELSLDLLLLLL